MAQEQLDHREQGVAVDLEEALAQMDYPVPLAQQEGLDLLVQLESVDNQVKLVLLVLRGTRVIEEIQVQLDQYLTEGNGVNQDLLGLQEPQEKQDLLEIVDQLVQWDLQVLMANLEVKVHVVKVVLVDPLAKQDKLDRLARLVLQDQMELKATKA